MGFTDPDTGEFLVQPMVTTYAPPAYPLAAWSGVGTVYRFHTEPENTVAWMAVRGNPPRRCDWCSTRT